MDSKIKTWLIDIQTSIDEIFEFLPEKRDFIEFQNDLKTKRAIERNLEIVGEAMKRILKIDPDFKITNSRRIVDTRNRVIHGYDSVSDSVIWAIVIRELPKLKEEVAHYLKE